MTGFSGMEVRGKGFKGFVNELTPNTYALVIMNDDTIRTYEIICLPIYSPFLSFPSLSMGAIPPPSDFFHFNFLQSLLPLSSILQPLESNLNFWKELDS